MTQPAKASEPTMEEILASIRRIIADDEPAGAAAATEPPAAPAVAAVPASRPAVLAPRPLAPPPGPTPAAVLVPRPAPELPAVEAVGPPSPPAEEPEVFDLTEAMAAPAIAEGFRTIDGKSDLEFDDFAIDEPTPASQMPAAPDMRPSMPQPPERTLISSTTSAAIDSAFNSLAHTVLVQNARTLEDLVREMLRPMLKTWLDDNLPGLVERLVRAEIERVSRGRG
jgi:cell pole-organizing protein PopZ